MEQKDPQAPWLQDLGLLGVITGTLVSFTLAGLGLGYLAWKKLDFPVWLMALTTLAGALLGMYRIYQVFQKDRR